jgi:hypothetical protein
LHEPLNNYYWGYAGKKCSPEYAADIQRKGVAVAVSDCTTTHPSSFENLYALGELEIEETNSHQLHRLGFRLLYAREEDFCLSNCAWYVLKRLNCHGCGKTAKKLQF